MFLLESAERSEAVVYSSGSLATHLTERWAPHLEVTAVQETVRMLGDIGTDKSTANNVENEQNSPLTARIDSDASHEAPAIREILTRRQSDAVRIRDRRRG